MKHILDVPQYLAVDVGRFAGLDDQTLNNWLNREGAPIQLSQHDRPGTRGRPHLLTLRRAFEIVITAELVKLGYPPRTAATAARAFTDEPDGYAGFGSVGGQVARKRRKRPAGHLYDGRGVITLLVILGSKTQVVPIDYDTPISAVLLTDTSRVAATILNLTDVVARVEQGLRVGP